VRKVIIATVNALLVFLISFGNTIQQALSEGKEPSKWQVYSGLAVAAVLMFNDIKSSVSKWE
jgi:hypothetical protein